MENHWWEQRRVEEQRQPQAEYRNPFERDRARVIHSAAFRRLQGKMQLLGVGESDFYRTRLTHSLEVSQVGRSLVLFLQGIGDGPQDLPPECFCPELIEAVCLAHDIGHPAFGHAGEVVLNKCMDADGGFEGNGQTLRIVSHSEVHVKGMGLNPTRRMLMGVLKYPCDYDTIVAESILPDRKKPPKCYLGSERGVVSWMLDGLTLPEKIEFQQLSLAAAGEYRKTGYRTLDSSIMDTADNIAYAVYDLEDCISLNLIRREWFMDLEGKYCAEWGDIKEGRTFPMLMEQLFGENRTLRKGAISWLIGTLITSVEVFKTSELFTDPLLRYNVRLKENPDKFRSALKQLITERVIFSPMVQMAEYQGERIIQALFSTLSENPKRLLKDNFRKEWLESPSPAEKKRVISDYIAGMTDEYASRMFERLFVPHSVSMFLPM